MNWKVRSLYISILGDLWSNKETKLAAAGWILKGILRDKNE